jgi:3-methyladenine DNA glycosylase AlkD
MKKIRDVLAELANLEKAEILQRFFKTRPGEYGEGDVFLGVAVPQQRLAVKRFWKEASLDNVGELLGSEVHDERNVGILILVEKFKRGEDKKVIYDFYMSNLKGVNNWDLVDMSAPHIVGGYLLDKKDERKVLYELVKSKNLWERRIAIISTFAFIRNDDFDDTLKIAEMLLEDSHDLIHKAVGWMLREVGKRDQKVEEDFLKRFYKKMPRTMLRYAIEKFEEGLRLRYLKGLV